MESFCPPPAYVKEGTLRPIGALQNNRYGRKAAITPIDITIPAGLHSNLSPRMPHYMPPEWTTHVSPEGGRFFVNSIMQVVTDTNIHDLQLYQRLQYGITEFQALSSQLDKGLPNHSELFIQLANPADEKCGQCNYYIVDHDTQTEYWLHPVDPYEMGIFRVTSESHIKYALQVHYWAHVEYFPHRPIPSTKRGELINILRHAQLDHLTSMTSTFPYGIKECEKFQAALLHVKEDDPDNFYTTSMTARLWAAVSQYKFDNCHGEEYARLDRLQYIGEQPVVQKNVGLTILFGLLLGFPKKVNEDLESVYVDDIVCETHWKKFMCDMTESWKDSRLMAIALFIMNAVFLVEPKGLASTITGLASICCCTGSLMCALVLLHKYSNGPKQTAAEAVEHLSQIEHEKYRLQPTAAVFSVPKAFVTWSTFFLVTEVFSIVLEFCTSAATLIVAAVFLTILGLLAVRSAVQYGMNRLHQYRRKSDPSLGSVLRC